MGELFADPGVGKSLLAMELALGCSTGQSKLVSETHWPQWLAPKPQPVLYVAGEMSLHTFQQRVRAQLTERPAPSPLHLLSSGDLVQQGLPALSLSLPSVREQISQTVKQIGAKLLILDNLDTLMDGAGDEDVYAPVKSWITQQSLTGLALLIVHHAGKSGSQRGTSTRDNPLDYIIRLERLDDSSDRIAFRCTFSKARFVDKLLARSFEAEFKPLALPHAKWLFRTSQASKLEQFMDIVQTCNYFNYKDIAMEMRVAYSHVYKLRNQAVERGLWDDRWNKRQKKNLEQMEAKAN